MQRTLVMVKPDGVKRALVGEIIRRIERKGFRLVALKMLKLDRAKAELHYAEHREKPFFDDLVNFITSGPVVAMVWEGQSVVAAIRTMMGKPIPWKLTPALYAGILAAT